MFLNLFGLVIPTRPDVSSAAAIFGDENIFQVEQSPEL